jgi:hypothetical protein
LPHRAAQLTESRSCRGIHDPVYVETILSLKARNCGGDGRTEVTVDLDRADLPNFQMVESEFAGLLRVERQAGIVDDRQLVVAVAPDLVCFRTDPSDGADGARPELPDKRVDLPVEALDIRVACSSGGRKEKGNGRGEGQNTRPTQAHELMPTPSLKRFG